MHLWLGEVIHGELRMGWVTFDDDSFMYLRFSWKPIAVGTCITGEVIIIEGKKDIDNRIEAVVYFAWHQ